ncbi:hypothetical protein LWI29_013869 [Acer saccharum]|uniref:Ubiquitin-like protease family profile domain-containing protein n=1 Tax=Acer saccharum TaxID=4024 RepID=A0AA39VUX5_ACESA|nr:hypothetical protein LWI29_013869 [Acer saccharum]
MPSGVVGKPPKGWSMLKYRWTTEDLTVVRGLLLVGNRPWSEVDIVLIPCNIGQQHLVIASIDLTVEKIYLLDPYRQEVTWHTSND